MDTLRTLVLCLGASTVTLVQVERDIRNPASRPRILGRTLHAHEGDPKRTLQLALAGIDLSSVDRVAATGRKFRQFVNLTSISEPEAVEHAYAHLKPADVACPAVV